MKYQYVIWDLDGTLLDTLEDLAASTNAALTQFGMPLRTVDEVRQFVGNGVRRLMAQAVPQGEENPAFEAVFQAFKQHYAIHNQEKTDLYPGIAELLRSLRERGMKMAVVSNKVDSAVQALIPCYLEGLLDYAIGEKEPLRRKPNPDMVWAALQALGVTSVTEAVYVGDSEVDVLTARNAGLSCIGVSWGFREKQVLVDAGAECIADTVEALGAILAE
jgi:phosphoglycolate phosphatase